LYVEAAVAHRQLHRLSERGDPDDEEGSREFVPAAHLLGI
jgi:hypothetical protein